APSRPTEKAWSPRYTTCIYSARKIPSRRSCTPSNAHPPSAEECWNAGHNPSRKLLPDLPDLTAVRSVSRTRPPARPVRPAINSPACTTSRPSFIYPLFTQVLNSIFVHLSPLLMFQVHDSALPPA